MTTFDLLTSEESRTLANQDGYFVRRINYKDTLDFILNIHYAKRIPHIIYAYGLFKFDELVGIVTYGKPASPALCNGLCGNKFSDKVLELNRLCLKYNKQNESSFLIARTFKLLPNPSILVSYADTEQNHVGYVYQATNWFYTGLSDKRTEWRKKNSDLHSKTICEQFTIEQRLNNSDFYVVDRPRKHRYVFFLGTKRHKKIFKENLKYEIVSYPK